MGYLNIQYHDKKYMHSIHFHQVPLFISSIQSEEGSKLKASTKELYDVTKVLEEGESSKEHQKKIPNDKYALPELVIENFDEEQVPYTCLFLFYV